MAAEADLGEGLVDAEEGDAGEDWDDDESSGPEEPDEDSDEEAHASLSAPLTPAAAPTTAAAAAAACGPAVEEIIVLPATIPSPFPGRPPVLRFASPAETHVRVARIEDPAIAAQLKYKCQKVTPNVMKRIMRLAGFKKTSTEGWLVTWGKHMKAEDFRTLAPTQKINHFPNSFQLGRKDCLWRNMSRMQARHGKAVFSFVPDTFLLPRDRPLLRRVFPSSPAWIVKPNAAARGIGIKVVRSWNEVPKQGVIVQRYLERPLLVNGSKFDMRVYVYVAGLDPLRIYLAPEGLARFATHKYSFKKNTAADRFMHLTNYSVNKKNASFVAADEGESSGHKWTLTALFEHLRGQGIDTARIWDEITTAAIKTIVSVEDVLNSGVKANVKTPYCCHELFGFDFLLDAALRVWVLEVNVSPSMHTSAPLDQLVKGALLRDVLNTTGVAVPGQEPGVRTLTAADRAKHVQFVLSGVGDGILDHLTRDDCDTLMAFEEERARCGKLSLIFPAPTSDRFRGLFTLPRYNNMLLQEWIRLFPRHCSQAVETLMAAASAPASVAGRSLRRGPAAAATPSPTLMPCSSLASAASLSTGSTARSTEVRAAAAREPGPTSSPRRPLPTSSHSFSVRATASDASPTASAISSPASAAGTVRASSEALRPLVLPSIIKRSASASQLRSISKRS
eukprot:m.8214 g.8214  ORF g.8214 m.8214 type:complete len:677 (-) comp5191_c0_seq1:23-2053(-)